MQSSRDSSLWRSLAVAFGDGLAFGVGVKLTQAAGRQLSAPHSTVPPRSDPNPLAGRVEQIEQNLKRIERAEHAPMAASGAIDQKVLEAIVNALEARLAEHSGQMDRRLADLDAKIAIELRSLDRQDHSIARQVSEDMAALQQQMVGLNREFGEAVAGIVAEQVGAQVQARAAAWEQAMPARIATAVEAALEPRLGSMRREFQESLATMVAEQVSSQVQARSAGLEASLRGHVSAAVDTAVGSAVPAAIESRLAAAMSASVEPVEQQLRAEVEQKDREIAELRQRLGDTDTNVLELILGIGQICRQAAARLGPSDGPSEQGSAHVESQDPSETVPDLATAGGDASGPLINSGTHDLTVAPRPSDIEENGSAPKIEYDTPLPGFAQSQKPNRLWRVPLVSSLVFATAGLVLRHYL